MVKETWGEVRGGVFPLSWRRSLSGRVTTRGPGSLLTAGTGQGRRPKGRHAGYQRWVTTFDLNSQCSELQTWRDVLGII